MRQYFYFLETNTSSKKDNAKMESVLSDLRKELAQEKERNENLQKDFAHVTEKEGRITKTLATVNFLNPYYMSSKIIL